jgi:NAD(P)-dependent dehydrogenase (short-subunit alcohol dehydrogenase family)
MKIKDIFNIEKKKFLVTGAYGLIGNNLCHFLAENNATVIAIGRKEKKLKNLGVSANFKTDISDESDVVSLWKNLAKQIKKIDVLVNNAAISTSNTFKNLTGKEWSKIMETNVKGTFLMCREGFNSGLLGKGSSIINISSIYGIVSPDQRIYGDSGLNSSSVYGCSKAGIIQLTKYLATYLAKDNIRVNCISLGGIFNNQPEYFLHKYIEKTPLNRMGRVDDILGTIVFLSSDKASDYITGANIVVDGGFTIW